MLKIIKITFLLILMVSVAYAEDPPWCIQVLRTSTLEGAKTIYNKIGDEHQRNIEKSKGSYTVIVGSFKNREEASTSLEEWKSRYPGAFPRICAPQNTLSADTENIDAKPSDVTKNNSKENLLPPEDGKLPLPEKPKTVSEKKEAEVSMQNKTVKKETPLPLTVNIPTLQQNKNTKKETPSPSTASIPASQQNKTDPKKTPIPSAVNVPPAVEKSSEIVKIPANNMAESLKTGMQCYDDKKYSEAIKDLSQYVSLSPKSEHNSAALYIIGKSLEEMGKPLSALKIFGRVLEQYPKSPEAFTGMIAMADISVNHPTLHYPVFMPGVGYVEDPILAYNKALGFKLPDRMMEAIRYKKGRALLKAGRHQESYDVFSALLGDVPQTVYKIEALEMMRIDAMALIDTYHQAGDHLAATNIFLEAKDKQLIDYEDSTAMLKASISFAHMGMFDVATTILNRLRFKMRNTKSSSELNKAAEAIEKIRSAGHVSRGTNDEQWQLYESGRVYLKTNDLPAAHKTLSKLKAMGGDPFWSKIADYALGENKWDREYKDTVNKKKK